MKTFDVDVIISVRVTLDETKFDDAFMTAFKKDFYPFETLEDHAKHLAQLRAREVYNLDDLDPAEFAEGYGPIGKMGITTKVTDQEEEID